MSLIICPECKKKISDSAEQCPNCGYKFTPEKLEEIKAKEKKGKAIGGIGCLSIIILAVIIYLIGSGTDEPKKPEKPKTATELRQEQINNQFSAWDGSHTMLTKLIKESMNDPDSYEHVKTTYWDKKDHLIVKTTFRGKNAFGGKVLNSVTAKVDMTGIVLKTISQEP